VFASFFPHNSQLPAPDDDVQMLLTE
jgi:hypothetical protein